MKQFKLPKEFATKWVNALRSGEYKQDTVHAQYYVPKIDCYCVMGVGAKVNDFIFLEGGNEARNANYIPFSNAIGPMLYRELYHLNDIENKTFPELADWIEENVEFIEEA